MSVRKWLTDRFKGQVKRFKVESWNFATYSIGMQGCDKANFSEIRTITVLKGIKNWIDCTGKIVRDWILKDADVLKFFWKLTHKILKYYEFGTI